MPEKTNAIFSKKTEVRKKIVLKLFIEIKYKSKIDNRHLHNLNSKQCTCINFEILKP